MGISGFFSSLRDTHTSIRGATSYFPSQKDAVLRLWRCEEVRLGADSPICLSGALWLPGLQ